MTTTETNDTAANESIDTDRPAPTDHPLGGVAVDGAGMQVQNVEDGARVLVEAVPTDPDSIVTLALRSDTISGRVYLDEDSAAALAGELAAAAQEVRDVDE